MKVVLHKLDFLNLCFQGNGKVCVDIDECVASSRSCDPNNGKCVNTLGSFECSCKTGFMLDGSKRNCTGNGESFVKVGNVHLITILTSDLQMKSIAKPDR